MTSSFNIDIAINPANTQNGEYLVEIREGGRAVAQVQTHINREVLLLHEHQFKASDYGMELSKALFADKVGVEYQRLVGRAGTETTVRIQLVISDFASELHALPWERLFHVFGDTDAPLAASAQTPFSRFLIIGAGDQPPIQDRVLHLLLAVANPKNLPEGLPEIDVVGEVAALADLLTDLRGRVIGTVLPGRSGLPAGLRQRLEQEGWTVATEGEVTSWGNIQRHLPGQHVLHILAHGQFNQRNGQTYLLLEDEGADEAGRGNVQYVADQVIVKGLEGVRPLPQLIFLAACESATRPAAGANPFVGLAPQLVKEGVPAVVAMQDLVPVNLAHTLTLDFYRRLFAHGLVDRALNEARSLVYEHNKFAWAIPVLFLRLRDGQLFSTTTTDPRKGFEPEIVFVRGGPFVMGSHPDAGVPEYETPQHSVELGDYYIGRYPVTNQEYAEFIRRVKTQDVPNKAGWFNRKPPSERLDHPVTGVSWHDAVAYCVWLSKETGRRYRLPSEAEWEKAARGTNGRRYPWGETWDDRYAKVDSQGIIPVASHPLGASPFGCQDMVGNVEEWTRTLWGNQWAPPEFGYPYDENDGRELATADDLPAQGKVVHRGGSYRSQAGELRCALRDCADPSSKIAWRGFRVVMEV